MTAGDEATQTSLQDSWQTIQLDKARAIAAAELLSDSELSQKMNATSRPTIDEQRQIDKTLLHKQFGAELIESLTYTHKQSGETLTGYESAVLRNRQGRYQKELDAFFLLQSPTAEAAAKDWTKEDKQLRQAGERFAGDISWHASKRELRESLGLLSLQPGIWYSPTDLQPIVERSRANADLIRNLLNCSIAPLSDGQVIGELLRQVGLSFDEQWVTPEGGGKRYKQRRINQQSWERAWQFVSYRRSGALQDEADAVEQAIADHPPSLIETDHPPVDLLSEARRGGDHLAVVPPPVVAAADAVEPERAEVPEPLLQAVQAIEPCRTLQEFAAIGQRVLTGKSEDFFKQILNLLTQESRQRVLGWARLASG